MALEVKTYSSISDLVKDIDNQISIVREMLGGYLKMIEDLREKAEKIKKFEETILKLTGKRPTTTTAEFELAGLKIVVGARPSEELSTIEDVVRVLQDKLTALQKVRKAIEPLLTSSEEVGVASYLVQIIDGIPVKILIKMT
ncbi:MAG: hypothetical protein QXY40_08900 [Candidatus Methanomethylicia archaeon]